MVRSRIAAVSLAGALMAGAGLAQQASAEIVAGTTFQNFLITWDSSNPAAILSGVALQGLQSNETLVGLDVLPTGTASNPTGTMYGVGSFGHLYTINQTTGMATAVNTTSFTPALNGSQFGVDWNPVTSQLRVVSNAKQNLVVSTSGVATAQTNVAATANDEGANTAPNIVHIAYSNNLAGGGTGGTTTLYGIDTGRDRLVTFANPSNGQFSTVGALNFDATELGGFDISGATGTAFATFTNANQSRTTFGSVNLTTGTFTPIGEVGGGNILTGMTILPSTVPAPASLALIGLGMVALRRRRA
jgi:MYXO-CTERM domain-containing protein